MNVSPTAIRGVDAELQALRNEVERLRVAIRLYGKHVPGCPVPKKCLCGLWNLQYPDKNMAAATDEQETQ